MYPFDAAYKYRLYYYIGDEPVEEAKWQSVTLKMVFLMGLDENRKYIIKYISNPAVKTEAEDPDAPTLAVF
jgi:hypothetical protein